MPDVVGLDYQQALRTGARDNLQNFNQKRFSIREDFTLLDLHGLGDHIVKVGAVMQLQHVRRAEDDQREPGLLVSRSTSRRTTRLRFPFQAQLGFGDPDLYAKNNQYGDLPPGRLGGQLVPHDQHRACAGTTRRDGMNNDYVTPAQRRTRSCSPFYGRQYFTDGTQRPALRQGLPAARRLRAGT